MDFIQEVYQPLAEYKHGQTAIRIKVRHRAGCNPLTVPETDVVVESTIDSHSPADKLIALAKAKQLVEKWKSGEIDELPGEL